MSIIGWDQRLSETKRVAQADRSMTKGRRLSSILPVVVFSTLSVGAISAVYYAHYQQKEEKKFMRSGVIRDIRRARLRRHLSKEAEQGQGHPEGQEQGGHAPQ